MAHTNPQIPAELAEIIETHRALFGGFTMMADDAGEEGEPADGAPDEQQQSKDGSEGAKPDKAADLNDFENRFNAQRKVNRDLEQKLADARQQLVDIGETAAKALRYEVAADKGIDLKLAARLNGSTKEELEADADVLKTLLAAAAVPTGPKPDPSQGHGSDPKPANLSEAIQAHYA